MGDQLELDERLTLTETLRRMGLSHRTAPPGRCYGLGVREIVNGDGDVVFAGRADEVWTWLLVKRQEVRRG